MTCRYKHPIKRRPQRRGLSRLGGVLAVGLVVGFGVAGGGEIKKAGGKKEIQTPPPLRNIGAPKAGFVAPPGSKEAAPVSVPPRYVQNLDGEKLWETLRRRAVRPAIEGEEVPAFSFHVVSAGLLSGGIQWVKGFRREYYQRNESGSWDMRGFLSAAEARQAGAKILLRKMKLVVFLSSVSGLKDHNKKAAGEGETTLRKAFQALGMKKGGRLILRAPAGELHLGKGTGAAEGGVVIELQAPSKTKNTGAEGPCTAYRPVVHFETNRIRWRLRSLPAQGVTELLLYTCAERKNVSDPRVSGRVKSEAPDGRRTTVLFQARGMILEVSEYDRPRPHLDEAGRFAGLSRVRERRVLFHTGIQAELSGSSLGALFPFAASSERQRSRPAKPAVGPGRVVVACAGPAVLDFGVPSRRKPELAESNKGSRQTGGRKRKAAEIPLAHRFLFLNGVRLRRDPWTPLPTASGKGTSPKDDPSSAPGSIYLLCRHFCVQYPPGGLDNIAPLPEFAEALGGIHLEGVKEVRGKGGGSTGKAPSKKVSSARFQFDGERLFYDGEKDTVFLIGTEELPVSFKDEEYVKGVRLPWFAYDRRFETVYLPGHSRKMLKFQIPPGGPLGAGLLLMRCDGESRIEKHPLPPEAGRPPEARQIVTLRDKVEIEQPASGMYMRARLLRAVLLVRNPGGAAQTVEPERLEARGAVRYVNGPVKVKGAQVVVDIGKGPKGQRRERVTIRGDGTGKVKAILWRESGAICAERIVVDRAADSFMSFGGTVLIYTLPKRKGSTAAPAAGGLPLKGGDRIRIQCNGPVDYSGVERRLVFRRNVVVELNGGEMRLWADALTLRLAPPATPQAGKKTEAGGLFTAGEPRTVECVGRVELVAPNQYLRCDRARLNLNDRTALLRMDEKKAVEVYLRQGEGTALMRVHGEASFRFTAAGLEFIGGRKEIVPYKGEMPLPRERGNAPSAGEKTVPERRRTGP